MDKKEKAAKINRQIKLERRARREVAIELQLPEIHSHVHKTSKRDLEQKLSKKVRREDWDD